MPTSGQLTSVKLTRNADDDLTNCTVYTAIYRDGVLIGVSSAKIPESNDEELILDIPPMMISEGIELKAFVWDENMQPAAQMLRLGTQ